MKIIKPKRKYRFIMIIMIFLLLISRVNHQIIKKMEPSLQALARHKVSNALNNIVKEILVDLKFDKDHLYTIKYSDRGDISDVIFDTYQINQLLLKALNTVDESLIAAQDGKKDPLTKQVFYEDGIIYQVPIGYFSKLFFLYDKGPSIKIWMRMLNDVNGDLKTELIPYGQNAAMIKITLIVEMKAEAITYFSRNEIVNTCEIPLLIQIIQGKLANYPWGINDNSKN